MASFRSDYLIHEQIKTDVRKKKNLIQNQQEETRGGVLQMHKMMKLPGGDVNTNGDEEYSDDSKEDDGVDQYGNSHLSAYLQIPPLGYFQAAGITAPALTAQTVLPL